MIDPASISLRRVGPNSWLASWSSDLDDPTFTIMVGGQLFATTKATSMKFDFPYGQFPVIEIRDGSEIISSAAATEVVLKWTHITGAVNYKIEQFVSGIWFAIATIKAKGVMEQVFHTAGIADASSTQFRISSISAAGIAGTPGAVTFEISRHPDPPDVTFTYDNGTNAVTIAAAA